MKKTNIILFITVFILSVVCITLSYFLVTKENKSTITISKVGDYKTLDDGIENVVGFKQIKQMVDGALSDNFDIGYSYNSKKDDVFVVMRTDNFTKDYALKNKDDYDSIYSATKEISALLKEKLGEYGNNNTDLIFVLVDYDNTDKLLFAVSNGSELYNEIEY